VSLVTISVGLVISIAEVSGFKRLERAVRIVSSASSRGQLEFDLVDSAPESFLRNLDMFFIIFSHFDSFTR
tara:strand:- start:115 stop:327 length:213 start_codon:yes stop_codon:yes gene_type:complete